MSISRQLADSTLQRLQQRLALEEQRGPEDGRKSSDDGLPIRPWLPLKGQSTGDQVGWVRVYRGRGVERVVNVGLVVPAFGLDSHMLFAFTPASSIVPHFTLDSVQAGGVHAYHLDLIARLDLQAHLGYMNTVYEPLTPHYEAGRQIEGLSPAQLAPRQLALMSPWMLAHRATAEAFERVRTSVEHYLDHWLGLLDRPLSPELAQGALAAALAERDRAHRAAIFDPEIDPVWAQVDRLIGPAPSARIRDILKEGRTP